MWVVLRRALLGPQESVAVFRLFGCPCCWCPSNKSPAIWGLIRVPDCWKPPCNIVPLWALFTGFGPLCDVVCGSAKRSAFPRLPRPKNSSPRVPEIQMEPRGSKFQVPNIQEPWSPKAFRLGMAFGTRVLTNWLLGPSWAQRPTGLSNYMQPGPKAPKDPKLGVCRVSISGIVIMVLGIDTF